MIISVLMGAPVLVYLGYATNAEGQPIINYREIFSPTKMVRCSEHFFTGSFCLFQTDARLRRFPSTAGLFA